MDLGHQPLEVEGVAIMVIQMTAGREAEMTAATGGMEGMPGMPVGIVLLRRWCLVGGAHVVALTQTTLPRSTTSDNAIDTPYLAAPLYAVRLTIITPPLYPSLSYP